MSAFRDMGMSRIIEADFSQQWVFPPSLEDLLPPDHAARFVRDFVDQLDLNELGIRTPRATSPGGSVYSPHLLLRVWLYGWLVRVRTHRKLEDACRNQLPLLWLTGMNTPDHNTLWRFWRDNKKAFRPLFRRTVTVAVNMGMVAMAFHALDGTKIRPASSQHSALHEADLKKLLQRVDEELARMEQEIADEKSALPCTLPGELLDVRARRAMIADELEKLHLEETKHLMPAEPEVQMIKAPGGIAFNYNAQAVADSAHGIIVAQDVVTDATDSAQLVSMLRQAEENLGGRPAETAADGSYSDQEQIALAEQEGHQVTVPAADRGELSRELHSFHFTYDADADCLICPKTQQKLLYSTTRKAREGRPEAKVYRCPVTATCPFGVQCTKNKRGREVEVTPCRKSVLRQAEKHGDGRLGEAMKRRMGLIERVFAWIKEHGGFRRFSVRGLEKVRAQWSLVCAVLNLKRIYQVWKSLQTQGSGLLFAKVA